MKRRLNLPIALLLVVAVGAAVAVGLFVANRGGETPATPADDAKFHIACSLLDESDVDAIIGPHEVDPRPDAVLLPSPEIASECSWIPEDESRGSVALLYVESADTAEDWSNQSVRGDFGVESIRASIPTNGEPIDGLGIEAVLLTGSVTGDGVRAPLQLAIREEQYILRLAAGDGGTPPSRDAFLAAARTAVDRAADFYAATGLENGSAAPDRNVCDYATTEDAALALGVPAASVEPSRSERRWLVDSCTWSSGGEPEFFVTVSIIENAGIGERARADGITVLTLFEQQKDAARSNQYFRESTGGGEEAFWSYPSAGILEGDSVVLIEYQSRAYRPEGIVTAFGANILEAWRSQ